MEYTVQKLAKIAGVSARTIRYYDEIGLLKPARINSLGYRIYGQTEVDRLQQILFYRELDVSLETIKKIIASPSYDCLSALREHRKKLAGRRCRVDRLIATIDKTIAFHEGRIKMTDKEKFEGFKQEMIEENERKYGKEIRSKYGDEVVDASNRKLMQMTQEQYEEFTRLSGEILDTLNAAYKTGDPAGALAQKAVELHRKWLCFYWSNYSKEVHARLGQMYVDDERFTAYYDQQQPGTAKFFRDAILIYTGS